jgi:hypothetical protein
MPVRSARHFRQIAVVVLFAAPLLPPATALARPYPTNACVGQKLNAAANACRALFGAWGSWELNGSEPARDNRERRAGVRLAAAWRAAEQKAAKKGADCAETTGPSGAMLDRLAEGTGAMAAELNAALTLGDRAQATCGARVLRAAGRACRAILRAEARLVADPSRDPLRARRNAAAGAASGKLAAAMNGDALSGCPEGMVSAAARTGDALAALAASAVQGATVSPAVPPTFTMYEPAEDVRYRGQVLHPICSYGTPYAFFAKRGTVNKLVYYFQGGGACFNHFTCSPAISPFDESVIPEDNPGNYSRGFADLANPANPFRDWNAVFVSYCTGDVHWGDASVTYEAPGQPSFVLHHRGYTNAQVVEQWAREHFVHPDEVFVTGSSAGAYGAIAGAAYLMENVYQAARFSVLGDAGSGVVTDEFLHNELRHWGIEKNLPSWIPELDRPLEELSIVDLWAAVASYYPRHRFGQYTTAYDGGFGSQTFFYQVMLNPGNLPAWLRWWEASCDWNRRMREINMSTAARASNFRYYVGAGSRHTAWGSDKVYTDMTGGVPPLVDWINALLAGSAAWTNVECESCNLLPGDPKPDPLEPPFNEDGSVTCE